MRTVFLFLFLICSTLFSAAQQGDFLHQLSFPSSDGGSVKVRLDSSASAAVMSAVQSAKTQGYRVCIFSDNSQTARGAAHAALAQLHQSYADLSGSVIYNNPFFKVNVGYCLTRTEATVLYGKLKYIFPKAFIVGEQLPVSVFVAEDQVADNVGDEPVVEL